MSTALLTPPPARVRPKSTRLLTAEDLAVFPDDLPSGPVRYELDDGHIQILHPHLFEHGRWHANVLAVIGIHAEGMGLGKGRGTVGIILRRNPDRLVAPDACFLTEDQFPLKKSADDYLETMPKLVVEVRGCHETIEELRLKAVEYLAAGVESVWVIDDTEFTITAYLARHTVIFAATDIVTAPFLPGFAVPVADFFA